MVEQVAELVVFEALTMAEVGPEVLLAAEAETAADLADQGVLEAELVEAETDLAHLEASGRAELEVLAGGAVMALVQAERAVAAETARVDLAAAHLEVLEGAGAETAQADQEAAEAEMAVGSVVVGSVVAAAEAQEELAMRLQKRSHGKLTCSVP